MPRVIATAAMFSCVIAMVASKTCEETSGCTSQDDGDKINFVQHRISTLSGNGRVTQLGTHTMPTTRKQFDRSRVFRSWNNFETYMSARLTLEHLPISQGALLTALVVAWFLVYHGSVAALSRWYDKLNAYPQTAVKVAQKTSASAIVLIGSLISLATVAIGVTQGGMLTEEGVVLPIQILSALNYQSVYLFDLTINGNDIGYLRAAHHVFVQFLVQYGTNLPLMRVVYLCTLLAPLNSVFMSSLATVRTILPSIAYLKIVHYLTTAGASVTVSIMIPLQFLCFYLRAKRGECVSAVAWGALQIIWVAQDLHVLLWMWRFEVERAIASMKLDSHKTNDGAETATRTP